MKYKDKKFKLPRKIVAVGLMDENWGWVSTTITNRTASWGYGLVNKNPMRKTKYLPENSIIIAVVDPGVGTERKPIAIKYNNSFLVGPDNGIFNYFLNEEIETFEIDTNKKSYQNNYNYSIPHNV